MPWAICARIIAAIVLLTGDALRALLFFCFRRVGVGDVVGHHVQRPLQGHLTRQSDIKGVVHDRPWLMQTWLCNPRATEKLNKNNKNEG
jgi:hypothetical protein